MFRKHVLFTAILLCFTTLSSILAQEIQPLPIDPQVRYGKLHNGLTYYIRHNEQPKDRADFYIAQNVGSILEEDNQRGLAHFLEHMAFDGTKNFPGHGMDEFIESVGMRGGENFNAYTSFDETVYMIMNAPVTNSSVIDSCLLILHDWSGFITLADTAIEKERNIIREEWRTRQDAQARIWEQQFPKMYPDSRYANRLPIGSIDVINNFKPEELRDYYKKWYRPDLQAIIIVGDINVDQVEAAVKRIFSDIPAPVNPAKRENFTVPDNDLPIISIAKDKEASNIILSIFYKHEKLPDDLYATITGLVKDYVQAVCANMMNERLEELLHQANPPFVYAEAYDGDYMISKTQGAWTITAIAKEGEIDSTLITLVKETERVKRYGFTASEYDRARINILKQYETAYNERDKQKNSAYTREYVRHFTNGGYIPGIETEYTLINQIAPVIPVEQVNQYIQDMLSSDNNIVISLTGPEKEGLSYPSDENLLRTFLKAQYMPVEPFQETVSNEPLIPTLPAAGKITKTETDQRFGATVLTLSNGVKVVLKPTEFKKDQVLMTATKPGGSTLFGNKDIDNLKIFNDVIGLGGLGDFSAIELGKRLAGKQVSCAPSLGLDNESLNGSSTPSDLQTLFELIYLTITAPRTDEEAYASYENRMKAQMKNLELNPMVAFSDSLTKAVYSDNPRAMRLQPEDFEHISYSRIMEMYKERFEDASGFVFTFVGNINTDSIRPYIEQYLATLPAKGNVVNGNPAEVPALHKGDYTNIFRRQMEIPKATVAILYSGQMDYILENIISATMLKQILDLVYMEKVREDEGGSYGVQTSARISPFPQGQTILQIFFDTDPVKRERMNAIIHNELKRISDMGPRPEDFKKTQDNMQKRHAENLQENSYWLNVLDNYYYKGFDADTQYENLLQGITPVKIQTFAKKLLLQGNCVEVVMEP
ncbi:M16 family metallopeptidase [Parabacteroides bouchesdurhonensis]|uniref:M16 family metallopeptidase n=1 Tax=Parabacteroides bouchesdurhonensis TaxID=1936995 RepID=UPI000C84753A|nr:M16 family metallopeptidase [Parabacteroides bouchesdurhonensis]